MKENPEFLKKKYDLHNTPEVQSAVIRTNKKLEKTNEKISQNPSDKIENYLDRFREIIERKNPEDREMGIQALKKILLDKFVTKYEDIPENWHALNERIIRERGQGGDWDRYSKEQKDKERKQQAEAVLADQEASLEQWIDYMASPDSAYMPDYIKYWAFRSITELSEFDKEKGEFPKRSKSTVKMFPDINQEALAYAIEAVCKKHDGEQFTFGRFEADLTAEQKENFKKNLTAENFAKLYGWANEQIHPIAKHLLPITEGEWRKYEQDINGTDNYKKLNTSIRGRGTGWCTAGENTAKTQLEGGDFYCYYTIDDDKNPAIPRIAIRMENGKIAEVRGIAYKQNLDSYMGDVLAEKLEEFPDKAEYLKKDSDMKKLTLVENKTKNGEQLDKEDLFFLYEINDKISGFGYQPDPRIVELRKVRKVEDDQLVIFECTKEQIATNIDQVNENTKAYIGEWNVEIYKKLPDTITYLYEKFPEQKIFKRNIELSTKTGQEYGNELISQGFKKSDYAQDMLNKMEALKQNEEIDIVSFSVKQLGLHCSATLKEIYDKAKELGLELCPPQVGPELRLSYKDQPNGEYLRIAMDTISDRVSNPYLFRVNRNDSVLWFYRDFGGMDLTWHGDNRFVFRFRKDS